MRAAPPRSAAHHCSESHSTVPESPGGTAGTQLGRHSTAKKHPGGKKMPCAGLLLRAASPRCSLSTSWARSHTLRAAGTGAALDEGCSTWKGRRCDKQHPMARVVLGGDSPAPWGAVCSTSASPGESCKQIVHRIWV